jgi:hypothetical protein
VSTWTYDPTTDIGKIRLLIGDTDIVPTTDAHFTDEEIQAMLTTYGSILMAASMLLEAWAASLTSEATSESIGDYSYSKKTAANKIELARKYREEEINIPASDIASMDLTAGSAITDEED